MKKNLLLLTALIFIFTGCGSSPIKGAGDGARSQVPNAGKPRVRQESESIKISSDQKYWITGKTVLLKKEKRSRNGSLADYISAELMKYGADIRYDGPTDFVAEIGSDEKRDLTIVRLKIFEGEKMIAVGFGETHYEYDRHSFPYYSRDELKYAAMRNAAVLAVRGAMGR